MKSLSLEQFIATPTETIVGRKRVFMHFAINSTPIEVSTSPTEVNFSENPKDLSVVHYLESFSLRDKIRESKMSPSTLFDKRLQEVVKYCQSTKKNIIFENRPIILGYLSEFIFQTLTSLLSDKSVGSFNLAMVLGFLPHMSNPEDYKPLQNEISKLKSSNGIIPTSNQELLNNAYTKFWRSLVIGIEDKYLSDDKIGCLSGRK